MVAVQNVNSKDLCISLVPVNLHLYMLQWAMFLGQTVWANYTDSMGSVAGKQDVCVKSNHPTRSHRNINVAGMKRHTTSTISPMWRYRNSFSKSSMAKSVSGNCVRPVSAWMTLTTAVIRPKFLYEKRVPIAVKNVE